MRVFALVWKDWNTGSGFVPEMDLYILCDSMVRCRNWCSRLKSRSLQLTNYSVVVAPAAAAAAVVVMATVVGLCSAAFWAGDVSCTTNKKYVINNPSSYKITSL